MAAVISTTRGDLAKPAVETPSWRENRSWRRFRRNRLALVSLVVLVALWAVIIFAPMLMSTTPDVSDLLESLDPPSLAHPLGTDANGRDILVRLIYGGRISLGIGVLAMLFSLVLGTTVGAFSGFYGKRVDTILMRITEAMLSLPTFFLVLAILAFLPGGSSVALVIGVTSWMAIARLVRGDFLRWKSSDFVLAAHAIGASEWRIMLRHILPQASPSIIVSASLGVAYAILTESGISYLGLGVQPPAPTWGNMLLEAQQYAFDHPWLAIYPGVLILITVVCFNAIGDGLRDAFDARMSQG